MRIASRCFLLLAQALIFLAPTFAYTDWLPVTPEEMKMTSIPQQPGAPAVMLYHDEFYDNPNYRMSFYTRIKILTDAGKKYADVEIPYHKKYGGEVIQVHGRTIQPDGSISEFDGKPVDRVLEKGNGHKKYVKAFAVPNAQVGSIVEYRWVYVYDQDRFIPPQWELQGDLFRIKEHFSFVPTKEALMHKHDQVGRGVLWSWLEPKDWPKPKEDMRTGKVELTLTNVPAFIEEPFMPPPNHFRYYIHFFYDFHWGKGAEFWHDEGKFWNKDIQRFVEKRGPAFAEAMKSTVVATDAPEQKARKIYAYVQSLQNLDFAPKRSQEEMKALGLGLKETRGAEDVVRQKMGDAEDLARLYYAMAKAANLEVRMMRVTSREDNADFDENYLDAEQLDHEIVLVKLNGEEATLDPGVRYCPFGMLYWKNADSRGLRQKEDGKDTEIAFIMGGQCNDAWLRRDATFKLTATGELDGNVQVTFKGQRALILRVDHWNTDAAGKKKALEDLVKGWLSANAEVELTNNPNWESDQDMVATFKVTTPGAASAGRRATVPVDIFQYGHAPQLPNAQREFPVSFSYPWRSTDHIHIVLPVGFTVESVPASVNETRQYEMYKLQIANRGSEIESLREEVLSETVVQVPNYPQLKSFFDKVKASDDLQAVVKGTSNAGN